MPNWKKYRDRSLRSGIEYYDIQPEGLYVKFKNGYEYLYPGQGGSDGNDTNTPVYAQSRMAALAEHGEFLNRLINQEQPNYQRLGGPNIGYRYPQKALSADDELKMIKIHNNYIYRGRNTTTADQLKTALDKKNQNRKNQQLKFISSRTR